MSKKIDVLNLKGEKVKDIKLEDNIFNIKPNDAVIKDAVVAAMAGARQGTAKVKTRSEVSGGGRKPYRQKGTGNARQGSIRAPQWKGGGVVFAATPRDYEITLNKKEKRTAMKSALTNCVKENNFIVIDELKLDKIKTKDFSNVLKALKMDSALVVLDTNDKVVVTSARNIKNVKTSAVNELNVYDILKYEKVLITKNAVKNVEEVYV